MSHRELTHVSDAIHRASDQPLTIVYVCGNCRGNTVEAKIVRKVHDSGLRYGIVVCPACAKQLLRDEL
jgi:hypothetical protein